MNDAAPGPTEIRRADYRPPAFRIEKVDLDFSLEETAARVRGRLQVVRADPSAADLILDGGRGVKLLSLALDGAPLDEARWRRTGEGLVVTDVPDSFLLETEVEIDPSANTQLSGLYTSGGNFCTQCEAEGFRNITFYPDRPDVMAPFRVRLEADKGKYPVLLSNGNLVEEGDAGAGRHYAVWDDPFPKPSYLFALVAGDLGCREDSFTTCSGRRVALRIYAAEGDLDKCGHAMDSLKKAMTWDEEVFGLEYDLDIYNIVAVSDFNMGAMENKSLNVFNTKYVLARPDTATDRDFDAIEGVIGHEYFHNWTGNRVTCRDWFQLSLKEGLTVFRDQEFSSDMASRAVKRIDDVRILRAHQFPEDSGPMAHPVRPDSYIEINNFYTTTVYNKGAEVIRMMHRLLGPANFRKGMDLYFERHDGQAVTCDDFVAAMEDASGIDLEQFRLWYAQAGTPRLHVAGAYDAADNSYGLTVRQELPATPGQSDKKPMHIPLAMGLVGPDGSDIAAVLDEGGEQTADGYVLDVREKEQTFRFRNVPACPVPSLLRGFSAPVRIDAGLGRDDLLFLLAHDRDSFARWEAGQTLAAEIILELAAAHRAGRAMELDPGFIDAIGAVLADEQSDKALIAEALTLPSETYLGQMMEVVDVDGIHRAREFVARTLAEGLYDRWQALYRGLSSNAPYDLSSPEKARRALRNVALAYLVRSGRDETAAQALAQCRGADNMTEVMAALSALAGSAFAERDTALAEFYDKWRGDPLVIDKWFAVQAAAPRDDVLGIVEGLEKHPAFSLANPNRARSLVAAFTVLNPAGFHHGSGGGYRFLSRVVAALDGRNPQLAARLVQPLTQWRRYDAARQDLMKAELHALLERKDLSKDVYEPVSKGLTF